MRMTIFLLLLWVAFFAGVVVWAYAPGRRQKLENYALIPLRDE